MTAIDETDLLECLEAEFMELMGVGDRAAFDFALENSDKANYALQALGMDMMGATGPRLEKMKHPKAIAAALSLWALCARRSFLDLIEKEVAPLWAEIELPKRVAMFEEMREEREHPEVVS